MNRSGAAALALSALVLLSAGCAGETIHGKSSRAVVKHQPAKSKPTFGETYVVAKGDTLYSIAFRNNLDYRELAAWNGIGSDYKIRIGQALRLTAPAGGHPNRDSDTMVKPATASPAPPVTTVPLAKDSGGRQPLPQLSLPIPAAAGTWEWPTRGKVARGFDSTGSKGIDIAGEPGQMIVASRAGRVVYSGAALKGYGELIIIKHDEQYLSAYGYNRRRLVEEGEDVLPGEPIAELGEGPEQKPLLHFEIRDRGRPLDPARLLPAR